MSKEAVRPKRSLWEGNGPNNTHSFILCCFAFHRHIKEEFEEIFSEDDLKSMNHDELAFAWFS